MSVLQYVGARYVPKIYTNTVDPASAEWEANTTYEPLTIVTFNNATFISRVPVPASVGNPVAAPNFWLESGSYNGFIAQLQQQVSKLQSDMSGVQTNVSQLQKNVDAILSKGFIKGKNCILVGDSYGFGYTPDGDIDGWCKTISEKINGWGAHSFYACDGGAGWYSTGGSGGFADLAINCPIDVSADKIDLVFIAGGYNDSVASFTDLDAAITRSAKAIYAKYPNAKLVYTAIGERSNSYTARRQLSLQLPTIRRGCALNKVEFHDGFNILHSTTFFSSDGIHPNANGQNELVYQLLNVLLGGEITVDIVVNSPYFGRVSNDTVYISIPDIVPFTGNLATGAVLIQRESLSPLIMPAGANFSVGTIVYADNNPIYGHYYIDGNTGNMKCNLTSSKPSFSGNIGLWVNSALIPINAYLG